MIAQREHNIHISICACVCVGSKFTNLGKLPNHWTDRDAIWHTYADLSGIGATLNKI